jgi:hypothetical protein
MRTRETIELELMHYAKEVSERDDKSDYMDYIQRMQLDVLMDIRDVLTRYDKSPLEDAFMKYQTLLKARDDK